MTDGQTDEMPDFRGQPNTECPKCEIIYSLEDRENPKICPMCNTKMIIDEKEDTELPETVL